MGYSNRAWCLLWFLACFFGSISTVIAQGPCDFLNPPLPEKLKALLLAQPKTALHIQIPGNHSGEFEYALRFFEQTSTHQLKLFIKPKDAGVLLVDANFVEAADGSRSLEIRPRSLEHTISITIDPKFEKISLAASTWKSRVESQESLTENTILGNFAEATIQKLMKMRSLAFSNAEVILVRNQKNFDRYCRVKWDSSIAFSSANSLRLVEYFNGTHRSKQPLEFFSAPGPTRRLIAGWKNPALRQNMRFEIELRPDEPNSVYVQLFTDQASADAVMKFDLP